MQCKPCIYLTCLSPPAQLQILSFQGHLCSTLFPYSADHPVSLRWHFVRTSDQHEPWERVWDSTRTCRFKGHSSLDRPARPACWACRERIGLFQSARAWSVWFAYESYSCAFRGFFYAWTNIARDNSNVLSRGDEEWVRSIGVVPGRMWGGWLPDHIHEASH